MHGKKGPASPESVHERHGLYPGTMPIESSIEATKAARAAAVLHVNLRHLPPVSATVGPSVPLVHGVSNAFGPQEMAQMAIIAEKRVFFTYGKHNVHAAQMIQTPGAVKPGKKMGRGIVINVVIIKTVKHVMEAFHRQRQIIAAGKRA